MQCKYKFQNKEKFSGKPYCTCFNEPCENLKFVCDNNCQIFEDLKELAKYKRIIKKIKNLIFPKLTTEICANSLEIPLRVSEISREITSTIINDPILKEDAKNE